MGDLGGEVGGCGKTSIIVCLERLAKLSWESGTWEVVGKIGVLFDVARCAPLLCRVLSSFSFSPFPITKYEDT